MWLLVCIFSIFSLLLLIITHVYLLFIGSFLVNGISAMVLFDSGASRSFMSLALSKRFSRAPGELDCPLDVKITDDRTVRVASVDRGCILRLFDEQFSMDWFLFPCEGIRLSWLWIG